MKAKNQKQYQKTQKNKEYKKEYIENNEEHVKAYMKEYRQKNKEKLKEYRQSPQGIKSNTINNWKQNSVIGDLDELYEKYVNADKCEICKKVFNDTYDRCLDHDHETGKFRQILCRSCNTLDSWKNKC